MSFSFSGISSGIDTASMVEQLMQLEALPQTRLKTKLTDSQNSVKALQELSSKFASLKTSSKDLTKEGALTPAKATSNLETIKSSASGTAVAGSYEFTVKQTSSAHKLSFATTAKGSDVVTGDSTEVTLTINGESKTIKTGDGTLDGLAKALNASGTGVKATTVTLNDGTKRLSVSAAQSGAANAFTLTAADGSELLGGATVTDGQDAIIVVGEDEINSTSNTFDKVFTGVSFTVSSESVGKTATITVASDNDKAKSTVKGLVDSMNEILGKIGSATTYGSKVNGKTMGAGALPGDSMLRSLGQQLVNTVFPPDGTSLAQFGIETDRYGKLKFDEAKFTKALETDPGKLQAALGGVNGLATRVANLAETASQSGNGAITGRIDSETRGQRRIQGDIDNWDLRLKSRKDTLQRQFTAMESALARSQSSGNWLSAQLYAGRS